MRPSEILKVLGIRRHRWNTLKATGRKICAECGLMKERSNTGRWQYWWERGGSAMDADKTYCPKVTKTDTDTA